MDGRNFDALTRRLAGNTSRRSVVRGIVGGVAAAIGVRGVAGAAGKVGICHYSKATNSFSPIVVNASSVNNHLAHGDEICANPTNGTSACTSTGCEITCNAGYDACDSGCCEHVPVCNPDCVSPANGTSTCTDSGCEVTCNSGYHACESGCCQDDPICVPACEDPANGISTCTYNGCDLVCDEGYHSCLDRYYRDICCQTCGENQFACNATDCCDIPPGMCWWQNSNPPYGWEEAFIDTYTGCRDNDDCLNGGACYKWTVGPNDVFSGWQE